MRLITWGGGGLFDFVAWWLAPSCQQEGPQFESTIQAGPFYVELTQNTWMGLRQLETVKLSVGVT